MGNSLFSASPLPIAEGPPTFDSLEGFANGRKKRVMVATEQEMMASKVPLEYRDYCAHKYIEVVACIRKNFPDYVPCKHKRHEWGECQYQDYVLRMMEYERERRLLARKQKTEAMAA